MLHTPPLTASSLPRPPFRDPHGPLRAGALFALSCRLAMSDQVSRSSLLQLVARAMSVSRAAQDLCEGDFS
jgi:hypothetical protein